MKHEEMMKAADDIEAAVAMMTGIKARFIAAGWTPENAEQLTIEFFKKG